MTTNLNTMERALAALDRNHGDIDKTRSWLEVFDRSALAVLDDIEEDILRDEDMDSDGAA